MSAVRRTTQDELYTWEERAPNKFGLSLGRLDISVYFFARIWKMSCPGLQFNGYPLLSETLELAKEEAVNKIFQRLNEHMAAVEPYLRHTHGPSYEEGAGAKLARAPRPSRVPAR